MWLFIFYPRSYVIVLKYEVYVKFSFTLEQLFVKLACRYKCKPLKSCLLLFKSKQKFR